MQSNDQQNDIQSLRKELLQAEQQRLDLESDKISLSEKCKFLEIDKGKVKFRDRFEFVLMSSFRSRWN
jgi:rootletin